MREMHRVIRDNSLGSLSSLRLAIMIKLSDKEGDFGEEEICELRVEQ